MLIMDGTELRYEALTVEGSREEDTRNVKKSDLEKYSLVLAEAQLLGDKKNMYLIEDAEKLDEDFLWEFFWYKD